MKYLLILMLIFSTTTIAKAPKYLEGAEITVTLKNGKQYKFSAEEYMVVKRNVKPRLALVEQEVVVVKTKEEILKNRIKVLGGVGPTGLTTTRRSNSVTVDEESGLVGGVGYDRLLNDRISIGGQVLTNGTATLGLGLDF